MKKVRNPVMIHQDNRDQSCIATHFNIKGMHTSKYHVFRSENVPKIAKKLFSSLYKAGLPTIYSYFPCFRLIIYFQCGIGPERSP